MTANAFTVLGAQGHIGRALVRSLRDGGHQVNTPARDLGIKDLANSLHGHVIYSIGLTADFRSRPWDTIDAHVILLRHLVTQATFTSLTYLSSTRVYLGSTSGSEDSILTVNPTAPDQLYNLSKLMGEALCYAANRRERPIRVIRLSNVVGGDINAENFICNLLRSALASGNVQLGSSIDSKKDYIALSDVTRMIELIASHGVESCYNLASGIQISNHEVIRAITSLTGATVIVEENAPTIEFPQINVDRLKKEFGFTPSPVLASLASLMHDNIQNDIRHTTPKNAQSEG